MPLNGSDPLLDLVAHVVQRSHALRLDVRRSFWLALRIRARVAASDHELRRQVRLAASRRR
jgi:hypothetical protein